MITAWLFSITLIVLPFFILYFYLKKHDIMNSEDEEVVEEFIAKFGAPMEGLHLDKRWSVVYPVTFLIRRVLFVIIVLQLFTVVVIQIGLQIVMALLAYAYLIQFEPFTDRRT